MRNRSAFLPPDMPCSRMCRGLHSASMTVLPRAQSFSLCHPQAQVCRDQTKTKKETGAAPLLRSHSRFDHHSPARVWQLYRGGLWNPRRARSRGTAVTGGLSPCLCHGVGFFSYHPVQPHATAGDLHSELRPSGVVSNSSPRICDGHRREDGLRGR